MIKFFAWLIVLAIIGSGVFIWDKKQKHKECEDRALVAAVDTYPTDEYPNLAYRTGLQENYKQRYISDNCQ